MILEVLEFLERCGATLGGGVTGIDSNSTEDAERICLQFSKLASLI